ncbi:potassium-transporting ATPase subunit KdpC [Paenibacillus glycanilyticus]|uniref:Potassium-transporting ATPase KdpC subunit n=1 Tax=Paenibacillus glycanilyticus TaxID=126569 RepID=A0ABQ6G5X9_9BACL|nr:potassium-transporting ATPase subunit KdpC [Paenibacillus glycanilyticus]GLX66364.1 potassium-transporting ATPase KdpC subunit [Paenibacillus glycanilyticus]
MRMLATIIRTSLVLMLVCGLLYNLAVTGIAQAMMPHQASGSLIKGDDGEIIGSELIGQNFKDLNDFQGRVSSIDYNAEGSGTPNYAPSNEDMIKRTAEAVEQWKKDNPDVPVSELPIDLITNSGSGLDPNISPKAASTQIPRISKLTGIPAQELQALVEDNTKPRELGFLGEPVVNVLQLNLALHERIAK